MAFFCVAALITVTELAADSLWRIRSQVLLDRIEIPI